MQVARTCSRVLLPVAFLSAAYTQGAVAAEEPEGWSFAFSPYIWASSLDGTVAGPGGQEVGVGVSFSDILQDLSFAFEGAGEVRYDRFGLFVDLTYASITSEQKTPGGTLFQKSVVDTEEWLINTGLGYRFYRDRNGSIDATAGARILILDTTVALKGGPAPEQKASGSKTIVSPIVGMRGHIDIADGFGVTGLFDVGGFGLGADFTWQTLATVDYEISEGIVMRTGFRAIGINYSENGVDVQLNWIGPVVGATFRF
jgi:hypothetical protein